MQIFIHRDDQDFGPYTVEQAQELIASGELLREDHAWYQGAPDWMPLEEIPGMVLPVAEPAPAPTRINTGLPAWIPPRRGEDTEFPTPPTSFAKPTRTPGPNPMSSILGQPAPERPTESAVLPQLATPEPELPVDEILPVSRAAGVRNLIIGVVLLIGGAIYAFHSYKPATADSPGNFPIVGCVVGVIGAIQSLRGIVQFLKA